MTFMLLESSIMLLENIYSTGITYDRHLRVSKYLIVQATVHSMSSLQVSTLVKTFIEFAQSVDNSVTSVIISLTSSQADLTKIFTSVNRSVEY